MTQNVLIGNKFPKLLFFLKFVKVLWNALLIVINCIVSSSISYILVILEFVNIMVIFIQSIFFNWHLTQFFSYIFLCDYVISDSLTFTVFERGHN